MSLDSLVILTEKLRRQAIGAPRWITDKQVFEYSEQSAKVVAVLKVVRAAHGINSMKLLCENGLFIDMGAITRCVIESVCEIYFLLESFPSTSSHVDQFVRAFFENTIDGFQSVETEPVPANKIRSAMVRVLTGLQQKEETRKRIVEIYQAYSGYIHANYAHVLEVYNGSSDDFNLAGVPSDEQRRHHMEIVEVMGRMVLDVVAFAAQKLELDSLHREIVATF